MLENPTRTKLWLFTDRKLLIEPPADPYREVLGAIISKSQYQKLLSISDKVNKGQELDLETGFVVIKTWVKYSNDQEDPDIWMKSSSLLEYWCDQQRIVAKHVEPENKNIRQYKYYSVKVLNTGSSFTLQMNRRSDRPLSAPISPHQNNHQYVSFI